MSDKPVDPEVSINEEQAQGMRGLEAQLAEARAVLREVDELMMGRCLFCDRVSTNAEIRPEGHAPYCRLKKVLGD